MDDLVRAFLEREQQLRVIARLGRGGFAEVWEVEAPSGVRSAVKVSLDPLDGKSPAVQKELENLKLIRALAGHPHLVTLIDYWVVENHLVTRWELATDGNLLQLCERYRQEGKPGIPFEELIKLMDEAADGLDFLHAQGIYHRDIKPQNLLLFHGHVKIGDLGLAKLVGASTASHTGSGTFGYLPPEAWEEHRLSPTVDLYSLAATYIRLRTGREPFGTNPVEMIERQKKGEPILEGLAPVEIPWLRAALASKPEERPQQGVRNWVRSLSNALRGQRPASVATARSEPVVARPAAQLKRNIVVDPNGRGDFRTLAEAIEQAASGGTIRLAEGTHWLDRPLKITNPVTLVGAGRDVTRVVCEGEGYVIEYSSQGRFAASGITFQHTGQLPADVLVVTGGDIAISECRFEGAVWDEQRESGGHGLWLRGTVWGVVEECESLRNRLHGIRLSEEAQPTLESNTCRENQVGIVYVGSASGTAWDNTCENNAFHGIQVGEQARPTLEGNTCRENKWSGIAYYGSASGTARNNTCEWNAAGGIGVGEQAQPTLEGNTCRENKWLGIAYAGSASGTARNNTCVNNTACGILVGEQAQPTLEGNTCRENKGAGIAYFGSASGTARNNICRENAKRSIVVAEEASPVLEGNSGAGCAVVLIGWVIGWGIGGVIGAIIGGVIGLMIGKVIVA
jgi:parallel beta-helix repeat protein